MEGRGQASFSAPETHDDVRHLLQLSQARRAALAPATPLRGAGARRDAVHHHPSGLRAVVQGAAARARLPEAAPRPEGHAPRARDAEAGADGPQGRGRPDRRPRDHDPARVPLVPGASRVAEPVPVVPVPGARGRAGPQEPRGAGPVPGGQRASPPHRAPPGRAHSVGCVPALPRRRRPPGAARAAGPGRDETALARAFASARPDRCLSAGSDGEHGLRAAGGSRRGSPGMALPAREDGSAHHRDQAWDRWIGGRRLPPYHAESAGVPRPVGDPDGARARAVTPTPRETPASAASRERIAPADLAHSPNPLAPHYSRFRVAERLLLTGHSHQAWPDVGFEGQVEAWADAAGVVDEKWQRVGEEAERTRRGYARLL